MSQLKQNQQNQSSKPSKDREDKLNSYARFSSLGIQMFAIIGVGSYIGVKLDENYPNKHNLYTLIFALVSVIISMFYVIKRIIAISKEYK